MMAEIRTQALVLRTFDHGESDRLVHLFTERCGRVSAIAKGAKRSRRRFPGTLEILTLADVRLVDPPRASLMRLESARQVKPFDGFVNDLGRFAIGCQLLELLDRFTGEREAHAELFRFARGALGVLRDEPPDRLLALLLRAKTLAWMGYRPQLLECAQCGTVLGRGAQVGFEPRQGGAVCADCAELPEVWVSAALLAALERGIRSPLRARGDLALTPAHVGLATRLLDRFFVFHVGLELRSAPFLDWALARSARDAELDAPTPPGDTSRQPSECVQIRVTEAPGSVR